MESEWRNNLYFTGNIGYLANGPINRDYHATMIARLVTPVLVSGVLMDHLIRYEYPAGRVTLWGTTISGGQVAPWGFHELPYQVGPFPHGYAVFPDTGP